jgi:hypothetical protein
VSAKAKTDPRAEFAEFSDEDLRGEIDGLAVLEQSIRDDLARRWWPTQAEAEAQIAAAQRRAEELLASRAKLTYDSLRLEATPSSEAFRELQIAATLGYIASDAFADAMREHYAAKRPSEDDAAPVRERLERTIRRCRAIRAELELRKLDTLRASEESKRETALAALEGE